MHECHGARVHPRTFSNAINCQHFDAKTFALQVQLRRATDTENMNTCVQATGFAISLQMILFFFPGAVSPSVPEAPRLPHKRDTLASPMPKSATHATEKQRKYDQVMPR